MLYLFLMKYVDWLDPILDTFSKSFFKAFKEIRVNLT